MAEKRESNKQKELVRLVLQYMLEEGYTAKEVNEMAPSYILSVIKNKNKIGQLTVDVDCSEALRGLKAVTREAKKATDALKELEEQKNKIKEEITITVDGNEVSKVISKT